MMSDEDVNVAALQQREQEREQIQTAISEMFAPEDEGLRKAIANASNAGFPAIQVSAIEGKLLHLLAVACNAHKILEIGSLAGYSGIWLARALPPEGRLITLEVDPEHAKVVRNSFAEAGVSNRAEVRVGKALDLLPQLVAEAPFDLIFIDADKGPYPQYLDWALKLSRQGSIIIGDNTVWHGRALRETEDMNESAHGLLTYNKQAASDKRLVSLALAVDDGYMDGFTISVVRSNT